VALVNRLFESPESFDIGSLREGIRYANGELSDPGGSVRVEHRLLTVSNATHIERYVLGRSWSIHDPALLVSCSISFKGLQPKHGEQLALTPSKLAAWTARYLPFNTYTSPENPFAVILAPGDLVKVAHDVFALYGVQVGTDDGFTPHFGSGLELHRGTGRPLQFFLYTPIRQEDWRTLRSAGDAIAIFETRYEQGEISRQLYSTLQFAKTRMGCTLENSGEKNVALCFSERT